MANKKRLKDPDWLFTVLTALVKKEGGSLRIHDKDMIEVTKKDVVGLFYDKKESCIILKLVSPAEVFGVSNITNTSSDLDN